MALSFYAANKVPLVARIVPTELKDTSVSEAPGTKLSYFGYELEVPWNDFDEIQTQLHPKDKPEKFKVDLHFRSGLRLVFSAAPPRLWTDSSDTDIKGAALALHQPSGMRQRAQTTILSRPSTTSRRIGCTIGQCRRKFTITSNLS